IGKKEKIKKKYYTLDLLEDIAKETFTFLNSIKKKGHSDTEEAERNTIKQEPKLKRKEVIKEKEEEKQHTIKELLKETQGAESTKNKDTKKIRQEDRLEPEDESLLYDLEPTK
ncbi:43910_t:CDS:2, partial [Gigaspora margarita]